MSNNAVAITPMLDNVKVFAEEVCHSGDELLTQDRSPVVFRVQSVGRSLGIKVAAEFVSDYGIYYDSDDGLVISELEKAFPAVGWGAYTYHKWPDFSKIHVLHPDTGKTVAQITTRKYHGRAVVTEAVDAGDHGDNVISFSSLPGRRAAMVAAADAERQRRRETETK